MINEIPNEYEFYSKCGGKLVLNITETDGFTLYLSEPLFWEIKGSITKPKDAFRLCTHEHMTTFYNIESVIL